MLTKRAFHCAMIYSLIRQNNELALAATCYIVEGTACSVVPQSMGKMYDARYVLCYWY